jgi:hypothetical protein
MPDARPSQYTDCRTIDILFETWKLDFDEHLQPPGEPRWTLNPAGRPMIICTCGHIMGLPHRIAGDGTVSPSLFHPATDDLLECGFHVFGRFVGWNPL